MSIEARNRPLTEWFTRIRTRQLALPRFQRPSDAWDHSRVSQMFNTILRDLPVGAGLILEVGNEEPFISRTITGAPSSGERVTEHLLDGQQRLTGLWRGLHNNYDDRTFFVYFMTDEETGLPYYVDSIGRWKQEGDLLQRPFWANDPKQQWSRKAVPLHLFSPDIAAQQNTREWINQATNDQSQRDHLTDQITIVRQKFISFNLPFMSLPVSTDRQTALDVFVKMNTSTAPLSIYDIVVAQIESAMGKSLHDLVAETRTVCPNIAAYYSPEDLALYGGALLLGRAPTNATYMAKDFGSKLMSNWDIFLSGVARTVDFLEQERVFDAARLPTDVVIPVLVALWGIAPKGLDAEGRARGILRRYLWRAFFSNRYEKSTNSRALADFIALKPMIMGGDTSPVAVFDDDLHPLPQEQELTQAAWPVRKDRLGRAILALALRQGGDDLADGGTATRTSLAKREYHHLFPTAHLGRLGIPEEQAFRSLNCALVMWRTNRTISDKVPERYLAERREGTELGENEIRNRLNTHLIPYDEMVAGDYITFLAERARLMHLAMSKLCSAAGG